MAEGGQVGFLFKAASSLPRSENNHTQTLLKSYYLMRCRDIAKDGGLPDKYFSPKLRCSHCFIDWKRGTDTKIRGIKLSKRQKRRINRLKTTNKNNDYIKSKKDLLNSNELEQICSFCKHNEITPLLKPTKLRVKETKQANKNERVIETPKTDNKKIDAKAIKEIPPKTVEVNVYSKAKEVYSLSNKNNTLPSNEKQQKVIKNNKKKKDKFAGLCQQAVLASAKIKQEKDKLDKDNNKQNKLNLFLKPSS